MTDTPTEERISEYFKHQGNTIADKKHGRTFQLSNGTHMCDECCNGDRCDDPTHRLRSQCPYCLGTAYNRTADELNAIARNNSQHLTQ
jgi:hypothetical protein